ncbi:MAG: protein kinase [Planctomycetes bacterium]|nr:protein kinase [Planctomycetota bacterium]
MDQTSQSSPKSLPRTADGFEIQRELGRGGMGVVYLAREIGSERELALKVLPAELCASEEAFGRFQREAVLAAAISDSRCVFVYGAHQFEGSPAIAMELVRGETLEQVIKRGEKIPVRQAVRWTIELLEGLDAAHRAGVLHRDVKPSNCFVNEDGHVKVGDFGLSRSLDTDVQLTQSGAFLGSPLYAAPEQVKGRKVDERSDMYSAAATLYALLTLKTPYGGSNLGEVLSRILTEPPEPPRAHRPEIPRALEKVILRAMRREPDDRFEDLAAFREALHPFSVEAPAGGVLRRLVAHVLDNFCVGMLNSIVFGLLGVLGLWSLQINASDGQIQMGWLTYVGVLESFLYFALFEGLAGATPGKWVMGLRTVDAKRLERTLPGASLRALLFTAPLASVGLTFAVSGGFQPSSGAQVSIGSLAGLIPSAVRALYFLATARRRNGMRGLHEILSRTRVIQRALPFPLPRRAKTVVEHVLRPAQGVPETIANYRVRGLVGNTVFGQLCEAEDPALSRRVWLCACENAAQALDASRRQVSRRGRLHWLGSARQGEARFEVFESPGGASLTQWMHAQGELEWSAVLQILAGLAQELELTERESPAQRFALEQVWIDRWGTVRLLDAPLDAHTPPTLDALGLIGRSAQLFVPEGGLLPRSLPGNAEPVLGRILGRGQPFADAREVHASLCGIGAEHPEVDRKQRTIQLAIAGGALALLALIVIGTMLLLGVSEYEQERGHVYLKDLVAGRSTITQEVLDAEDIHARELALRQILSLPGGDFRAELDATERARLQAALQAVPTIDAAAMRAGQERLEAKHARPPKEFNVVWETAHISISRVLGKCAVVWMVLALLGGLILRGGLTLRVFGMLLRDARGRRAGALRCSLRSFVAWSPLLLWILPRFFQPLGALATWSSIVGSMGLLALGAAFAIWRPRRGLPDLVAGTWIAPR